MTNLFQGDAPFTAGPYEIHSEGEIDGAAVFSADGEPFCLIDPDTVIGGNPLPRAEAISKILNSACCPSGQLTEELASLRSERAMLVAALENLDRMARRATFGGWRHNVADITGTALGRAEECAASRARRRHAESLKS